LEIGIHGVHSIELSWKERLTLIFKFSGGITLTEIVAVDVEL
jgi:hypothetical protein